MSKCIRKLIQEPCGVIVSKKRLAPKIYELVVHAPAIVHNAQPGQFVIAISRKNESKPIPLTIADMNHEAGTLTFVIQAVGVGTMRLLTMEQGEQFFALQGPSGHPSEIKKYDGRIVCVAGGVGIAPTYPVIRALKEAGNEIVLILGAREEQFLFWEEKIRAYSDNTVVCIEKPPTPWERKGGIEGLVTPYLAYFLASEKHISHVFAAGPLRMLEAVAEETKKRNVNFIASAVSQMIDGTGMCAGCQCNVGDETILLCQRGPEINGNLADWDKLFIRLNSYRDQESRAMDDFRTNDPRYLQFMTMEGAK